MMKNNITDVDNNHNTETPTETQKVTDVPSF